MLKPHPTVLRRLVEEYEAVAAGERAGRPAPRAEDLAYTLCVSTGTRDVRQALAAAREWLTATGPASPSAAPVPAVPMTAPAARPDTAAPVVPAA
ncbi:DUF5133 domain-containing protein [Streptomyces sp. CRN 30]|uniref:DUF5133 domain-containing protein n=1 Tax=Streptomyces sp. CRN 30 TaxID=3075613 RepID=UPI002A80B25C|nr:DUF5133 domain-containing protein [Streptomyces sp. CRN 30]